MRKPRDIRYKIKAKYEYLGTFTTFYCKVRGINNITNEMGESMPFADGYKIIETDSDIDFKQEHNIWINGVGYAIEDDDYIESDKDLNSMRGKPRYIKKMLVR